jgi:hypothetical protein
LVEVRASKFASWLNPAQRRVFERARSKSRILRAASNSLAQNNALAAYLFLNIDFISVSPLILGRGCRAHRASWFAFTPYSENRDGNL